MAETKQKELISMDIDSEIMDALRKQAMYENTNFPALIRRALREFIFRNTKTERGPSPADIRKYGL